MMMDFLSYRSSRTRQLKPLSLFSESDKKQSSNESVSPTPRKEEQGGNLQVATNVARRVSKTSGQAGQATERDRKEQQAKGLKEWAITTGLWITVVVDVKVVRLQKNNNLGGYN